MRKVISLSLTVIVLSQILISPSYGIQNCAGTPKLGFEAPLSGGGAVYGNQLLTTMKYAVDRYISRYPSSLNFDRNLVLIDDQGEGQIARTVVPNFIADPCIVGVVGPAFSGAALQTREIYDNAGLTTISATASGSQLEYGIQTHFFRLVPNILQINREVQTLITQYRPNATVASLEDDQANQLPNGAYSISRYLISQRSDPLQIINSMKALGVNVVYMNSSTDKIFDYIKMIKENLPDVLMIFSESSSYEVFSKSKLLSSYLDGAIFFPGYLPIEASKYSNEFSQITQQHFSYYDLEIIDATYLFLEAIANGNNSRDSVWKYIKNVNSNGYSGPLKFTQYGERDNAKEPRVIFNNSQIVDMADSIAFANAQVDLINRKNQQIQTKENLTKKLEELSISVDELRSQVIELQNSKIALVKLPALNEIKNRVDTLSMQVRNTFLTISSTPYFLISDYFAQTTLRNMDFIANLAKLNSDLIALKNAKVTITCIKGKLSKKISAVNPICPSGYKVK